MTKDSYVVFTESSSYQGTRPGQQDRCYSETDESGRYAFGIVCDGMGGMESGEVASTEAIQYFCKDFKKQQMLLENYHDFFIREVEMIDSTIAALENKDGGNLNTGTTLVAAAIRDGMAQWVSVGDSKIYLIREDHIYSLVREHNYMLVLDQQFKKGMITQEEYLKESQYGAGLISYIGMGDISIIDANEQGLELIDHDLILICSDGLSNALKEERILEIIRENPDHPGYIHRRLQEEARYASANKPQDNTTLVTLLYRAI